MFVVGEGGWRSLFQELRGGGAGGGVRVSE